MSNFEPKTYSKLSDRNRAKRRRSSAGPVESNKKDNLSAVIVDSGAYNIKAGFSGDVSPTLIPNCIMKAKSERKRLFIGDQINECRDCSGLYFLLPCERGYITKWDVQKPVWDYVFSKNVCPINDNPVIVTQPLFNFKSIQDCIDEIFFEEYEVASMFRLNPTDLVRLKYAEDRKLSDDVPCIVVDTGFSFTHIIPYIKGNKYLNGIRRLNVGGKLLTNHLKDIISYRQYNVMEETYVINQVKEDTCYVAEDVNKELQVAAKSGNTNYIVRNYVLPDFNNIRRGYIQDPSNSVQKEKEENCQILRLNNERFIVPEILFHPSDIGMKSMGIAEAVVKSIYSCPKDQQEKLAKNVVLVGGNCKFPGFKERMYTELRSQLPDLWELNVFEPDDPISYAWKGGKPLLRTPDFKNFLVTKEEYEELGSSIIQQRFNTWMTDNSAVKEEPKKSVEIYKYLDKIKGRTIFGKHDNGNAPDLKTNGESTTANAMPQENSGSGTPVSLADEADLATGSEETSQDSFQPVSEPEIAINRTLRKPSVKTSSSITRDYERENSDALVSEDLTNSIELFPLGTGSYL
ncbi:actin-related protein 6 [Anoplophora glabripennis]|nr:actin-related protein 6 [Anoplophora glabripennis]